MTNPHPIEVGGTTGSRKKARRANRRPNQKTGWGDFGVNESSEEESTRMNLRLETGWEDFGVNEDLEVKRIQMNLRPSIGCGRFGAFGIIKEMLKTNTIGSNPHPNTIGGESYVTKMVRRWIIVA
uniref:Uncharacterized protein n=1 Tax=Cacopsylla melanoneura TaxID=428564 RepID=A0A8D8VHK9_9HEMI